MIVWQLDSVTPSDGRLVQFVRTDHTAWIKGKDEGGSAVYVHVQMGSYGVSHEQLRMLLDGMVAGLNGVKNV